MEGQDSFIMRQPEDGEAEFGEDDEDVVADAGNNADLYVGWMNSGNKGVWRLKGGGSAH